MIIIRGMGSLLIAPFTKERNPSNFCISKTTHAQPSKWQQEGLLNF
jgi:hypothetical protein